MKKLLLLLLILGACSAHAQRKYTGGTYSSTSRAADTTYGTATLRSLGDMTFPVRNALRYHFKFVVVYQTAAVTTGLQLGLTTPTFTIFSAGVSIFGEAAAGVAAVYSGTITASGGSVTSQNVVAATTDYIAIVEGIIIPSANGTLQLQWSPEVAANATIRQGTQAFLWTY